MPRRRVVAKRRILPDPIYGDQMVTRFMAIVMEDGKKAVAERTFYSSMERIRERMNDDPLKIFLKAVENSKPLLEVKTRRVGGANYQIPIEVNPNRRQSLAIRWLRDYARQRPGKSFEEKLAEELMDAAQNRGGAIKKKEDTHRMAEANKAFAHYRW